MTKKEFAKFVETGKDVFKYMAANGETRQILFMEDSAYILEGSGVKELKKCKRMEKNGVLSINDGNVAGIPLRPENNVLIELVELYTGKGKANATAERTEVGQNLVDNISHVASVRKQVEDERAREFAKFNSLADKIEAWGWTNGENGREFLKRAIEAGIKWEEKPANTTEQNETIIEINVLIRESVNKILEVLDLRVQDSAYYYMKKNVVAKKDMPNVAGQIVKDVIEKYRELTDKDIEAKLEAEDLEELKASALLEMELYNSILHQGGISRMVDRAIVEAMNKETKFNALADKIETWGWTNGENGRDFLKRAVESGDMWEENSVNTPEQNETIREINGLIEERKLEGQTPTQTQTLIEGDQDQERTAELVVEQPVDQTVNTEVTQDVVAEQQAEASAEQSTAEQPVEEETSVNSNIRDGKYRAIGTKKDGKINYVYYNDGPVYLNEGTLYYFDAEGAHEIEKDLLTAGVDLLDEYLIVENGKIKRQEATAEQSTAEQPVAEVTTEQQPVAEVTTEQQPVAEVTTEQQPVAEVTAGQPVEEATTAGNKPSILKKILKVAGACLGVAAVAAVVGFVVVEIKSCNAGKEPAKDSEATIYDDINSDEAKQAFVAGINDKLTNNTYIIPTNEDGTIENGTSIEVSVTPDKGYNVTATTVVSESVSDNEMIVEYTLSTNNTSPKSLDELNTIITNATLSFEVIKEPAKEPDVPVETFDLAKHLGTADAKATVQALLESFEYEIANDATLSISKGEEGLIVEIPVSENERVMYTINVDLTKVNSSETFTSALDEVTKDDIDLWNVKGSEVQPVDPPVDPVEPPVEEDVATILNSATWLTEASSTVGILDNSLFNNKDVKSINLSEDGRKLYAQTGDTLYEMLLKVNDNGEYLDANGNLVEIKATSANAILNVATLGEKYKSVEAQISPISGSIPDKYIEEKVYNKYKEEKKLSGEDKVTAFACVKGSEVTIVYVGTADGKTFVDKKDAIKVVNSEGRVEASWATLTALIGEPLGGYSIVSRTQTAVDNTEKTR